MCLSVIPTTSKFIEQTSTMSFDGNILYVGGSGEGNYTKIQDAINNASSGDTVFVYNGTYYENLVVDKSIELIGEEKNTTIIDGNDIGDVIYISADWVNISRFTITNSGVNGYNAGIEISPNSNFTAIYNNKLYANQFGILIKNSNFNNIYKNSISEGLTHDGIRLIYSNNNNVSFNQISSYNGCGIHLEYSNSNNFFKNSVIENLGIGITMARSDYNNFENNNISGNLYDGMYFYFSNYTNISNNYFFGNNKVVNTQGGLSSYDSKSISINHNKFYNNLNGISLSSISNVSIFKNIYLGNAHRAIESWPSQNQIVSINDSFGTSKISAIQKLCSNNVKVVSPELNIPQYIDVITENVTWSSNREIRNGLIILGNITLDGISLIFNASYGMNFIQVQGSLKILSTSITSMTSPFSILYLTGSNGAINNSIIEKQKSLTLYSKKISVNNCTLRNAGRGITVLGTNNIIINSKFKNNTYGLYLYEASFNVIESNQIIDNNHIGIILLSSHNNSIISNIIWENEDGGIWLERSDNNNFKYNDIYDNFKALSIARSFNNLISSNNLSNNGDGIQLSSCSNTTIIRNNISSNTRFGIYLYGNGFDNIIFHNNIINNSAKDGCDTVWDDGEYGNYWSDYEEKYPDAKKKLFKGIWDTPYEIEGGDNKDNYPLINQYPKSVIKSKSRDRPWNYNFPLLSWLLDRFPLLQRLLEWFIW